MTLEHPVINAFNRYTRTGKQKYAIRNPSVIRSIDFNKGAMQTNVCHQKPIFLSVVLIVMTKR
jgi:hypothetical protein